MPAYLSYPQLLDKDPQLEDFVEHLRTSNGTLVGYSLADAPKRTFPVSHVLTAAEHATFMAYYEANRTADIDFTWSHDGNVYVCQFGGPPREQQLGGGRMRVTVELVEV